MVKKTNERVMITLPKKMVELLKFRGNLSDQIKKALIKRIGGSDVPSEYELLRLGIDTDGDIWEQLGFYD